MWHCKTVSDPFSFPSNLVDLEIQGTKRINNEKIF